MNKTTHLYMKELFDIRRFWYYARVRYSQDKFVFYTPLILLGITLFFIISTFAFGGVKTIGKGEFASFVFYMPFIMLCAVNASRTFQPFHTRDKGFMLLTLPASVEEKFLFGIFNSVIVFGTLFIASFYLCTWITDQYNIRVIRIYNYSVSGNLWELLMMNGSDGKLVFPPSAFWLRKPLGVAYDEWLRWQTGIPAIRILALLAVFKHTFPVLYYRIPVL